MRPRGKDDDPSRRQESGCIPWKWDLVNKNRKLGLPDAVGAELSRSNRVSAHIGCAHKLPPDWVARAECWSRRSGVLFAAAIGAAVAAFAVPPAALAQVASASSPAPAGV